MFGEVEPLIFPVTLVAMAAVSFLCGYWLVQHPPANLVDLEPAEATRYFWLRSSAAVCAVVLAVGLVFLATQAADIALRRDQQVALALGAQKTELECLKLLRDVQKCRPAKAAERREVGGGPISVR